MFDHRSNEIDYKRLDSLVFIGCYQRRLPVSISRMIENAYDWEHLPYVHQSTFQDIELVSDGDWGWQAITTQPDARRQHIELLVDKLKSYWATTVLSGDAKGFEIHTQATRVADNEIDIMVNFYLPQSFGKVLFFLNLCKRVMPFVLYRKIANKMGIARVKAGDTAKVSILKTLQSQYSVLYDEDEMLMTGRQQAIDRRKNQLSKESAETALSTKALSLGNVADLNKQLPKVFQFDKHRFVLNQWNGDWVIYGADCPHLLGPLKDATIDHQGKISCPWHGYRFDVLTGRNCSNDKAGLPHPPVASVVDGELIVKSCS